MSDSDTLDEVLEKVSGWGKFQLVYYSCLGFLVLFSVMQMSYIFSARDINYRCYIPECENLSETTYNPKWLVEFVPYKDESPSSCLRYALPNNACSNKDVRKNNTVKCDTFVYQRRETTIVQDFNVTCDENLWKLTIVGTLNVAGELICLPVTGFISDKYGRKHIMLVAVLMSTTAGIIRSYSETYGTYLLFEFLDTALGSGTYGSAFIMAMELSGSKQRNVINTIICCVYALGEAILGLIAWLTPSWRIMLRILYTPGVTSLIFFWTLPESVRWLLSANRKEDAKKVILQIAKINKREIQVETLDSLILIDNTKTLSESERKESFKDAIKSRVLLTRTINCSFAWMCCSFVYYGLTIHSVTISENLYISFMLAVAVEIPGFIIYYFINEKTGRRKMMFVSIILGGICCTSVGFIPKEIYGYRLGTFLVGKCCLTIAHTVLYVFTTEMLPTSSRHSLFAVCSIFGRVGSMMAPQVPLLARVSKKLPLIMFGLVAVASGALSLLFPETLNVKLPDTIEEAVNIGKRQPHSRKEVLSEELKNITL